MHLSTLSPAKPGKRVIATIIDYTFIFTCTFTYVMTFGQPNEQAGLTFALKQLREIRKNKTYGNFNNLFFNNYRRFSFV